MLTIMKRKIEKYLDNLFKSAFTYFFHISLYNAYTLMETVERELCYKHLVLQTILFKLVR